MRNKEDFCITFKKCIEDLAKEQPKNIKLKIPFDKKTMKPVMYKLIERSKNEKHTRA